MAIHGHHSGTGRLEKGLGHLTGPLHGHAEAKHEPKQANKGTRPLEHDHAKLGGPSHPAPSGLHFPAPQAGKKDGGSIQVDLSQVFNSDQNQDSSS